MVHERATPVHSARHHPSQYRLAEVSTAPGPPAPSVAALVADDVEGVFRVFRVIRRRVLGCPVGVRSPPPSHLEVLAAARRAPGLRIGDVAARLRLASNTVSAIAADLDEAGLVERRRDDQDPRCVRLFPTGAAEAQVTPARELRLELLESSLAGLAPADRDRISAALPALGRLVEALQEQT